MNFKILDLGNLKRSAHSKYQLLSCRHWMQSANISYINVCTLCCTSYINSHRISKVVHAYFVYFECNIEDLCMCYIFVCIPVKWRFSDVSLSSNNAVVVSGPTKHKSIISTAISVRPQPLEYTQGKINFTNLCASNFSRTIFKK